MSVLENAKLNQEALQSKISRIMILITVVKSSPESHFGLKNKQLFYKILRQNYISVCSNIIMLA